MNYANFPTSITLKYGIRLLRWAVQDFLAPGRINSVVVLHLLYNSWENGVTTFQVLDANEWKEWTSLYHEGRAPPAVTIREDAAKLNPPTAAQQTADWGALLGPGQTLAIRIYQLSNRLGRGDPAVVTLQF